MGPERFNYAFVHGDALGGWVWTTRSRRYTDKAGVPLAAPWRSMPGMRAKRTSVTSQLTVENVATELIKEITRAGMEDVVLVGHSLGGPAIAFMAGLAPELFRRLVYVSCLIPLPGQNVAQMMGTGLHGGNPAEVGYPLDPTSNDDSDRCAATLCNDMNREQAAEFLAKLGADEWPPQTYTETEWRCAHLGQIPATYALCHAIRDFLPAGRKSLRRGSKVDEIVRVDAGHQVMNTRPEALAGALRFAAQRGPIS
jgi:pimeloyl-ACP methyl ester carboxylesterase